jgi:hypothetical protein
VARLHYEVYARSARFNLARDRTLLKKFERSFPAVTLNDNTDENEQSECSADDIQVHLAIKVR